MSSKNLFEKTFEGGKEIDKKINASLSGGLESETEEETKKAQMQNSESLENLEERERVLTLLHSFYQERQKDMPVHREIGKLAEKIKSFLEKANVYRDSFYGTKSYVKENDWNPGNKRNEYLIHFSRENETEEFWQDPIKTTVPGLKQIILNKAELKESEKEEIIALIQNLEKAVLEIDEKVEKLWEIRKNIAKELILTVPEFADFKDAELFRYREGNGLYNLDSAIRAGKIFETEKGKEEKNIYFGLDFFGLMAALKNLEQKFSITEEELKNIKKLEWSAEDKEKLKNLMEDVSDYKAEAEKLKEGLLKSANFKFKERGVDLVKDEFIRAFIRQLYEDYKLPIIHKERVVQEIMNGTFSF